MKRSILYKIALMSVALVFSLTAQARLAGKNVVLVHGFQSGDLSALPNENMQRNNARAYWTGFWGRYADRTLYWSSAERVSGGIKDSMQRQIQRLAWEGTCAAGCIFVTHSTGDLVLRDALTRLRQWGVNRNEFRVDMVLDFAGAGGGTKIADYASSVGTKWGVRHILSLALGFVPNQSRLGVLTDLRPANARAIGTRRVGIPRLRFVGTGNLAGGLTGNFITGSDDGVIGLHSACGSTVLAAYNSCSPKISPNGLIGPVSAPAAFLPNHYPVLMASHADHREMISAATDDGGDYAPVASIGNMFNFDIEHKAVNSWWRASSSYRKLNKPNSHSMSGHVVNAIRI